MKRLQPCTVTKPQQSHKTSSSNYRVYCFNAICWIMAFSILFCVYFTKESQPIIIPSTSTITTTRTIQNNYPKQRLQFGEKQNRVSVKLKYPGDHHQQNHNGYPRANKQNMSPEQLERYELLQERRKQIYSKFHAKQNGVVKNNEYNGDLPNPIRTINTNQKENYYVRDIFIHKQVAKGLYSQKETILIWLHGSSYSSSYWIRTGILEHLAMLGFTSYAIDIPGYGESKTNKQEYTAKWLVKLIDNDIKDANGGFVIIAPGFSGMYAMPLLMEPSYIEALLPNKLVGMVAITPTTTEEYDVMKYAKVRNPICIVSNENDQENGGNVATKYLLKTTKHKLVVLRGGNNETTSDSVEYISDAFRFKEQVTIFFNEFFD